MTFSDFQDFFPRAVTGVQVAKLLWDYQKRDAFKDVCTGSPIDEDCEYMTVIEALHSICDYVSSDDESDEEASYFYFSDQTIMEYYRLCQEYARMKGLPFGECTLVQEAANHVREWLEVIDCYYCGYELETDTEKQWGCGIRFLYDMDYFWEFYPLLQRMLKVLSFFQEKLPALRREVDATKRPFAIVPYEPKGAAA